MAKSMFMSAIDIVTLVVTYRCLDELRGRVRVVSPHPD